MSLSDNIQKCIDTRAQSMELTDGVLEAFEDGRSEVDLRTDLLTALASESDIHRDGWYSPPPRGVGVLFADPGHTNRSKFPSIRREPHWPKPDYILTPETTGMVYMSPAHAASGIIADFGFSFYRGTDPEIQQHLTLCLQTLEDIADHAATGMRFCDLNAFGQKLYKERKINNQWLTATHNPNSTTLGHTVPWSYELPTEAERAAIQTGSMNELKDIISHKRLYVDKDQAFPIPDTIAFTVESQLASNDHPELPNVFFHLIVTFIEGQKRILGGFNPIFDTLGMNYIRSRY
jgi:hypothetical protein